MMADPVKAVLSLVAVAIATSGRSAQDAFMAGEMTVGGDLTPLIAHGRSLAKIDDLFAGVRARTVYPTA